MGMGFIITIVARYNSKYRVEHYIHIAK